MPDSAHIVDSTSTDPPGIIPPGTVLQDRFVILELVGRGATATVYRARRSHLNDFVAIKIVHSHLIHAGTSMKRFFQEAKILSTLNHPNLVKLIGYGSDRRFGHYMILEYVDGLPLKVLIQKAFSLANTEAHLTGIEPEVAVRLAVQICEAMMCVHSAGVVHRDLKPENIVLTNPETLSGAKVIDFGIALSEIGSSGGEDSNSQRLTATSCLLGSPLYMSPEQCAGRSSDSRSDIYSLGCILYEMLCGFPPFSDEHALTIMSMHLRSSLDGIPSMRTIPVTLEKIVLKCLEKNPAERFESMSELNCALTSIDWSSTSSHFLAARHNNAPILVARLSLALSAILLILVIAIGFRGSFVQKTGGSPPRVSDDFKIERKLRPGNFLVNWSNSKRIGYYRQWLEKYGATDSMGSIEASMYLGQYLSAVDKEQSSHYLAIARERLEVRRRALIDDPERDPLEFGKIHSLLADCLCMLDMPVDRLNLLESDVELMKRWGMKQYCFDIATCLHALAGLQTLRHKEREAISLLDKEILVHRRYTNLIKALSLALMEKARWCYRVGLRNEVEPALREARGIEAQYPWRGLLDLPEWQCEMSRTYYDVAMYQEALDYSTRAAANYARCGHDGVHGLGLSLNYQCEALCHMKQIPAALRRLKDAVRLQKSSIIMQWECLRKIVNVSVREKESHFSEIGSLSRELFEQGVRRGQVEESYGGYQAVCEIYCATQRSTEASQLFEYISKQIRQLSPASLLATGKIVRLSCVLYGEICRDDAAIQLVSAIRSKVNCAEEPVEYLQFTETLILCTANAGHKERCLSLLTETTPLALRIKEKTLSKYVNYLLVKGAVLQTFKINSEAKSCFQDALVLCRDSKNRVLANDYVSAAVKLSTVYIVEGNFTASEQLLVAVCKPSAPPLSFPVRASALLTLAAVYTSVNKPAQALARYTELISAPCNLDGNALYKAQAYGLAAELLKQQGKTEAAVAYRKQSIYLFNLLGR